MEPMKIIGRRESDQVPWERAVDSSELDGRAVANCGLVCRKNDEKGFTSTLTLLECGSVDLRRKEGRMHSIARSPAFVKNVRKAFEESGICIADWARENGFSPRMVYQVLEGRRKCIRGQSHRIAVALGIKEGGTPSIAQFSAQLNPRDQ